MELNQIITIFIILVLSFVGLAAMLKLSFKRRWFDVPGDRSSHTRIVPRTAGISIFIISFLTLITIGPVEFNSPYILISYVCFFAIGVYDDIKHVKANTKFWGQFIISVALAILLPNFRINNFYGVLGLYSIDVVPSILFTSFVFIVVINAYNLIDGVDGLAATFAIFAFLMMGNAFMYTQPPIFIFCILLSVVLIPFYFFNFSKTRKMFLGDTGALFLGLTIVLLVGFLLNSNNAVSTPFNMNRALFALVSLCYPLIDTLRVFTLRLAKGQSPFIADRRHLHHKLLEFGLNHFATTFSLLIFNICIFFINANNFKNMDVNAVLVANFIIIAAFFIAGQRVSIWFSKNAKN